MLRWDRWSDYTSDYRNNLYFFATWNRILDKNKNVSAKPKSDLAALMEQSNRGREGLFLSFHNPYDSLLSLPLVPPIQCHLVFWCPSCSALWDFYCHIDSFAYWDHMFSPHSQWEVSRNPCQPMTCKESEKNYEEAFSSEASCDLIA